MPRRSRSRPRSPSAVPVGRAQLLLAIAEHESLAATLRALPGLTREDAVALLRSSAHALGSAEPSGAPVSKDREPRAASRKPQAPLIVMSDGAARGNPGPAGAGAVLLDASGRVLARLGRYLDTQTNNVAEYEGLLLGLRAAQEMGARRIEVRADSQLLIRQLEGSYRVKNERLKELFGEAKRLLRGFDEVSLRHVPREENELADEMSNRAIDERMT